MLFLDLMPAEAKQFDGFYAEFELAALQIGIGNPKGYYEICLLYTSPSPRDRQKSRMPSSA